ncbi:MBL fold metallo-hydrolase [Bosea sp. TND4EK4]|uniref:MBL fold metallo-hydrolase n=1 Tax=Bosea sp. TND4EK4 TaxID=1907408 RepID=UPI00158C0CFD|nr:MBL fold metallo-hydrolase [Bosea sp. TND4EK4]
MGSTRHFGSLVGLPVWGRVSFPALVALIQHPKAGPILFDTGYGSVMTLGGGPAMRLYRAMLPLNLPPSERLDRQLAARGFTSQDLAFIFLSHAHPDHVGGLCDLSPRPLLWSRAAAGAFERSTPLSRFREATLDALRPPAAWVNQSFIEDRRRIDLSSTLPGFEAGFDLLNDGSLLAIALPGHARGQHGLLCRLASGRQAFLVADAAWHIAAITHAVDPKPILDHIAEDPKAYWQTLKALRRLHAARPDIAFLPSHCTRAINAEFA